ncbi:MAG: hypothetical protein RIQ28_915, partial [Pseudomonadota bacterium]
MLAQKPRFSKRFFVSGVAQIPVIIEPGNFAEIAVLFD